MYLHCSFLNEWNVNLEASSYFWHWLINVLQINYGKKWKSWPCHSLHFMNESMSTETSEEFHWSEFSQWQLYMEKLHACALISYLKEYRMVNSNWWNFCLCKNTCWNHNRLHDHDVCSKSEDGRRIHTWFYRFD